MSLKKIDDISSYHIKKLFEESIAIKTKSLNDKNLINVVKNVCELAKATLDKKNKIFLAGNGGSAADAQHIAAEFVCRFEKDRIAMPAIALSTDSSVLTAISNDLGFESIFSRQIEALGTEGDLFIGITTSGNSKNIINAFNKCTQLNISKVAFCGLGGDLSNIVDYAVRVPSVQTARIQECHILIGHIICSYIENKITNE